MNNHNNNSSSNSLDRAPTPVFGSHCEFKQSSKQKLDLTQKQSHNPALIMGPITRNSHEKMLHLQQKKSTKAATMKNAAVAEEAEEADQIVDKSKSGRAWVHRVLIIIDLLLMGILLSRLLPYEHILSLCKELWEGWNNLCTRFVVSAASEISELSDAANNFTIDETDVSSHKTMSCVTSIIKHAFYPFLLFVPSLIMIGAAVATIITLDTEGRSKIVRLMCISSGGLFTFLSVMVAFAESSRWLLLGVTSVVIPVILMLLARLSVVYAGGTESSAQKSHTTPWIRISSWNNIVSLGKESQHYALTTARMIGFVFAFLPFLAGFMYVVSPPYMLVVPVSSLTTCAITGVFGIIPMLVSILAVSIGVKATLWTLAKLIQFYSWAVKKSFSVLLFLTVIAILMTAEDLLRVPSYA